MSLPHAAFAPSLALRALRPSAASCRGHRKCVRPARMALPGVAQQSLDVLVVGSGGREHALVDAVAASPYARRVIAAPGNPGMDEHCERATDVGAEDVDRLVELAVREGVELVVVGPEVPLVGGLADELRGRGIKVFGPEKAAAELEGSKAFMKGFLERHGVPSAWYGRFTSVEEASAFIREKGAPIVVKADGLAAGKGVVIAKTVEEGVKAVEDMLVGGVFGDAGREVVVEEFLEGEEVSFFAVLDGDTAVALESAQDHKAVGEGDTGVNTGGMGAYSPAPICDAAMKERIMETVVLPTMRGMREEGRTFRGVLYCGMMVDKATGEAKVLEFNVRFGDPECQVLCKRMKSDLLELLYRGATDTLGADGFRVEWHGYSSVVVVLAARGYPGAYSKGTPIRGLDAANAQDGVTVFHAGTAAGEDGALVSSGGRVLGVTATGESISEAQEKAYQGVDAVDWPEGFCRRDIGWRAVEREQAKEKAL